jgi:hypothetical protein
MLGVKLEPEGGLRGGFRTGLRDIGVSEAWHWSPGGTLGSAEYGSEKGFRMYGFAMGGFKMLPAELMRGGRLERGYVVGAATFRSAAMGDIIAIAYG